MNDFPKPIKRLIRQLAAEAHERELHLELAKLDLSFDEWRRGGISSGELANRIHRFHQGPARELWKSFNAGLLHLNVAYAIVAGILDREQVPDELLEALAGPLAYYQDLRDRDELRMPGE